jgi:quinoprotein glucose dehydrogenase
MTMLSKTTILSMALVLVAPLCVAQEGQWHHFGGDQANTKYSPLAQINRDNFDELEIAWRWESIDAKVVDGNPRVQAGQFKVTPLVVDGLVYMATAVNQLVAVDAKTGLTVWEYDPQSYKAGRPANIGWQHRGVEYWSDGDDARIFCATQDRKLIALDAKTGEPDTDFGDNGSVDLLESLGERIPARHMTHTSPPAVCNDTIVVGSIIFDRPILQKGLPGHVRGFDVRTGKLKWVFHVIPKKGEFGYETWEDGSAEVAGAGNVWSMFAVDEKLDRIYLPTSTPTNDFYGGHRPGDNLFAESIVSLNADTGERVWHFQAIHHGIWDYDFPTAANLVDVTVDGVKIPALAQISKQGFTYVFNRETGKPIWPIEERAVPQSTVPGEKTSPTQPFPTKPAPFEQQGFLEDDVLDFTPELREKALKILSKYTLGPIFTPHPLATESAGTIQMPGDGGGANWMGAAVDPETGIIYIPSSTSPSALALAPPDPNRSNFRYLQSGVFGNMPSLGGLPLNKPPYGRVTAIDLNTGDHVWMTPNGWGPVDHRALKDLNLGPLGQSRGGPLVTKTLLFVNQTRGFGEKNTPRINVFDKATGEMLGHIPLPENPYGNPVTFSVDGKQYLAVAVGGGPYMTGLDLIAYEDTVASKEMHEAFKQARKAAGSTKAELVVFSLP